MKILALAAVLIAVPPAPARVAEAQEGARAAASRVVLPVNGQLTFDDVRVSTFNVREARVVDASGRETSARSVALRVYFRDNAGRDLAFRATVGTRFDASGRRFEVAAIEPRFVTFLVR